MHYFTRQNCKRAVCAMFSLVSCTPLAMVSHCCSSAARWTSICAARCLRFQETKGCEGGNRVKCPLVHKRGNIASVVLSGAIISSSRLLQPGERCTGAIDDAEHSSGSTNTHVWFNSYLKRLICLATSFTWVDCVCVTCMHSFHWVVPWSEMTVAPADTEREKLNGISRSMRIIRMERKNVETTSDETRVERREDACRGHNFQSSSWLCIHFFTLVYFSSPFAPLSELNCHCLCMWCKWSPKQSSRLLVLYLSLVYTATVLTAACSNGAILFISRVVRMCKFISITRWISYPCKPVNCNDTQANCFQR